jgi:transcriptional regulator of heat shock response
MSNNHYQEQVLLLENRANEVLVESSVIKEPDDLKLKYKREVEDIVRANNGELSALDLKILEALRVSLRLLTEEAFTIRNEVLQPYREYKKNLQDYRRTFVEAIRRDPLLKSETRKGLKRLQEILNLNDEDVKLIEAQVTQKRKGSDGNRILVIAALVGTMLLAGIGSWAIVSLLSPLRQEPTSHNSSVSQPLL